MSSFPSRNRTLPPKKEMVAEIAFHHQREDFPPHPDDPSHGKIMSIVAFLEDDIKRAPTSATSRFPTIAMWQDAIQSHFPLIFSGFVRSCPHFRRFQVEPATRREYFPATSPPPPYAAFAAPAPFSAPTRRRQLWCAAKHPLVRTRATFGAHQNL